VAQAQGRSSLAVLYIALAALIGVIAQPALAAPARAPLLTIADGPVQVLRGALRYEAAEGTVLAENDIVRTAASTRVARIEFADGRVLDLGPSTQALLLSARLAQAQGWAGATALVAQGWAKLSAGDAAGRLVTPHVVAVSDAHGTVLTRTDPDGHALAFAESRGLTLLSRGADGAEMLLREGESWTRSAGSAAQRVSAKSSGLREVPRALADTLPRRAAFFDGTLQEPTRGAPAQAADLGPWLLAEPKLMALLQPPTVRRTPSAPPRRTARALPPPAAARDQVPETALSPTVSLRAEPVATVHLSALNP
jgi:hypothetical protein